MGNLNLAEKMIKASKLSGADYAKFQTWSVNNLKPTDPEPRMPIIATKASLILVLVGLGD